MFKIKCLCGKYRDDTVSYISKYLVGYKSDKCGYCAAGQAYYGECRNEDIINDFNLFINKNILIDR